MPYAAYRKAEAFERTLTTAAVAGVSSVTKLGRPRLLTLTNAPAACAEEIRQVAGAPYYKALSGPQRETVCRNVRATLRERSINTVLATRTSLAEARANHVRVADRDVERYLRKTLVPAIVGKASQIPAFTKITGLTEADLRQRAREDVTSATLRRAIVRRQTAKLGEADVRAYYDQHRSEFVVPERRRARIIVSRTAADAARALAETEAGTPFAQVARERSIDRKSAQRGGSIGTHAKIEIALELREALFGARKGAVVGPVAAPGGFVVLQVQSIKPAQQLPYREARTGVRQVVRQSDRVWQIWQKRVLERQARTVICAKGFNVVALCGNRGPEVAKPKLPSPTEVLGSEAADAVPATRTQELP
ncbi:peptidyl-prolyl cis-trans isomerase [Patulibacter sp. NPDC049589]|uniref:peptidylprolyl isomerase n=1 Tax=Patulibacter sp. NPDC049589 TaxID=3154731 RepID=UPI003431638A